MCQQESVYDAKCAAPEGMSSGKTLHDDLDGAICQSATQQTPAWG
jgi:hypothetical protein